MKADIKFEVHRIDVTEDLRTTWKLSSTATSVYFLCMVTYLDGEPMNFTMCAAFNLDSHADLFQRWQQKDIVLPKLDDLYQEHIETCAEKNVLASTKHNWARERLEMYFSHEEWTNILRTLQEDEKK